MVSIDMRLEAMDTHLVVALHALLQEQSVTRAARRVGVTQPTMSHALSKLRDHFGDALLAPAGRGLQLTPLGTGLVVKVAEAIQGLERVFTRTPRFDAARSTRTFRLVSSDNLELLILPRLAAIFAAEAPRALLRCGVLGTDWADRLRRGEIDLKLGRAEKAAPGLRTRPLARETLVCLVRRGHPATRGRFATEQYAACDHLLVSPRGTDTGLVDRALAARGLERRVAMTVSHFLVAPFIVASSDLVVTMSARVARTLAPSLDLETLACPVPLPGYGLAQVWSRAADEDEGHRWLRRAVERAAAVSAAPAADASTPPSPAAGRAAPRPAATPARAPSSPRGAPRPRRAPE